MTTTASEADAIEPPPDGGVAFLKKLTPVAGILVFLFWPRAIEVDTAVVSRGPIDETVADQGIARVRNAYAISAPVAGRVERITLEVGDRVVAGRTVAARRRPSAAEFLDPRERAQADAAISGARANVSAAEADRDRANVQGNHADTELKRALALAQSGVLSQQELDNARSSAAGAQRQLLGLR